ncbi:MAG: SMI1/KNR4 family protein [Kordia sp.]|uniref:SMI1/KNR4 family protein n=1 Tax=Kordia sp. TaxID=1965332 RepID=UPI00385B1EFF
MKNTIKFNKSNPLTDVDIAEIENFTGFNLPKEIKSFLKKYADSTIMFDHENYCIIDLIFTDGLKTNDGLQKVDSLNSIKEKWKYRDYLHEFQRDFQVSNDFVESSQLFPLIETHLGCQIYVSIGGNHLGKIFHVDNGDFGFCHLANSLDEFLDKCYPG